MVAAGFGFVELGQLLMQAANRWIGRFVRHLSALLSAFQVERTVVFGAHDPSPAWQRRHLAGR
jgi:hypothetical protein